MSSITEQLNPQHIPTVQRVKHTTWTVAPLAQGPAAAGVPHINTTYLATCPACDWTSANVSAELLDQSTGAHTWRHHPELRPEPAPIPPAHEVASVTRPRGELKLMCRCGLGWTGGLRPVIETMADHAGIPVDTIVADLEERAERHREWAAEHGLPETWGNQ